MAIGSEAISSRTNPRSVRATEARIGRWGSSLPFLLTLAGAVTVMVGSYMAWATFYAGLVSRDGVAGHGKYFIGLAAASVLAAALSTMPGVSRALRWVVVPVGLTIAFFAIRDLRNLDTLVNDPAAGFYVPGHGHGLYVVIAGAFMLILAGFSTAALPSLRPLRIARTLAALTAVAGVGMLIPALYGEYYLHLATGAGHVHSHSGVFDPTHLLNIGGVLALLASFRLWVTGLAPQRLAAR
jgi:hypothetical protein